MRMISELLLTISSSFALSLAVKATIVAVVVLVAYRLTRRSRAAIRHLLLFVGFAILPLLPLAATIAPSIHIKVRVPRKTESPEIVTSGVPLRPAANHPAAANSRRGGSPQSSLYRTRVIAGIWAAGAALFFFPMVSGLWQLHRIRRFGKRWNHGEAILKDLALDAGIKTPVAVLVHDTVAGPITFGVFRHAIVFPSRAERWSEADLRRATLHELEHVLRHDCLTQAIARLVCALYWFHPLVWMSWWRLGLEAERACDDAVLARAEATEYADQLVTLAKSITLATKAPILAMASRSDLSARVAAVLDADRRRGRAHRLNVAAVSGMGLLLTAVISPLLAVSATEQGLTKLQFEVASIKQNQISNGGINRRITPGSLIYTNIALVEYFEFAYGISPRQLSGPDWLVRDRYDIVAKSENPGAGANEIKLMLRSLLEQRFKATVHHETKETSVLALVVVKDGPKFRPSNGDDGETKLSNAGYDFKNTSMTDFVRFISPLAPRQVVDRTGLQGLYNFTFRLDAIKAATNNTDGQKQSVFDAAQDSMSSALSDLGLGLESQRAPMDFLVIDSIERTPIEN